jgi:hypothetical protein
VQIEVHLERDPLGGPDVAAVSSKQIGPWVAQVLPAKLNDNGSATLSEHGPA